MKSLLVFAAAVLLTSCGRHSTCGVKEGNESGEFVFEIEYVNHAWGVQHKGMVIDGKGRLYRYDNPAWAVTRKDEQTDYSAADLKAKYGGGLTFIKKLDDNDVEGYYEQALAIKGALGERSSICADAGETIWIAYIFDANSGRYKRLDLMLRGDTRQTHSDARATRISEWLRSLDKPYTDFPCAGE